MGFRKKAPKIDLLIDKAERLALKKNKRKNGQ
jgi:hypothetical protein